MARKEAIQISKSVSLDDLRKRIKATEKDVRILKRLYFVLYRYRGYSVEESAKMVGVTKMTGYYWQNSWNKNGYNGIKPDFEGGRPSKLTDSQKEELIKILKTSNELTAKEIHELIQNKFGIMYDIKHVRKLMKKLGIHYLKRYKQDSLISDKAEENIKKLTENDLDNSILPRR